MAKINRVAILGANRLGAEIAAHLANCGVSGILLDRCNPARVFEEIEAQNQSWNLFFLPEFRKNVVTGAFEENLSAINDCDWIIDSIDDPNLERDILSRVSSHCRPDVIISTTNTGAPVCSIAEMLTPAFRPCWLGTVFHSPVQHKKLVEIIPCTSTDNKIVEQITEFCEEVLGKGVVIAKDTRGFIAERISGFSESHPWSSLEAVDVRDVVYRQDEQSEAMWKILSETLIGTADVVEEIAEDITQVDNALRWGSDWVLGPFQLWDAIGVERAADRLRSENRNVPEVVERLQASGNKTFYRRAIGKENFFDFKSGEYKPVKPRPGITSLRMVQAVNGVVSKNPHATILDLGDGVECLEVHSPGNAISNDAASMLNYAIDMLDNDEFEGLIIGNHARDFCMGILYKELLSDISNGWWPEVQRRFEDLQRLSLRINYSQKPIAVAAYGQTLGYGCSLVLHAASVCSAAETLIGFNELSAGLIPVGGGAKEAYLRFTRGAENEAVVLDGLRRLIKAVADNRIATNAFQAMHLGIVPNGSRIVLDRDKLIEAAKQEVTRLIADNWNNSRNPEEKFFVLGESAYKVLAEDIARRDGTSDYDKLILLKLARVLTGGNLNHPGKVSEKHLLDLELEALMTLSCEDETFRRLTHEFTGHVQGL